MIKAGGLREKVKKGQMDPKEVLTWIQEQPEPRSKSFITWLKNQIRQGGKKKKTKKKGKKTKK